MSRSSTQKRSLLAGVLLGVYFLLAGSWLLAAGIRLSLRDLSPWTAASVIYYATPGPILLLGAAALGIFCGLLHHRRGFVSWCLLCLIVVQCAGADPAGQMRVSQSHAASQETGDRAEAEIATDRPTHRLLFWNISHLQAGLWSIAEEMKAHQPDLIALVEAGPPTEELREVWQKHFPDYEITLLGKEMLFMVRGGVAGEVRATELDFNTHLREIDVTLAGSSFTTMIVDIYGQPTLSRKTQLLQLAEVVRQRNDRPLLMAGDFNTPSDSLLFQPLQTYVRNAFAETGRGYAPTWPLPVPVLTIDQVWGNSSLRFLSCQAGWSPVSDHRPILVEFQIVH